jgi:hypothetical protein
MVEVKTNISKTSSELGEGFGLKGKVVPSQI